MKKVLLLTMLIAFVASQAFTQWGTNNMRTETRDNASAYGTGVKSGFYETSNPSGFPSNISGQTWMLLDTRTSDASSNHSMQFAGYQWDKNLYFRKTLNYTGSDAPWSKVVLETDSRIKTDAVIEGAGGIQLEPFNNGSWIDMPITGSSGLGSNGPGQDAWIAYVQVNGQWFANGLAHDIAYRNEKGRLLFGNSHDSAAAMTIDHNRVGIGTSQTNDPNYRLFVDKGIRTRKVRVDQSSWSDYVFEPSYRLASLPAVEKYIQENKHLPDVPSAQDVDKEGIDLGSIQATLLKKIEELTLYAIEQNKKLEEQGQQIIKQQQQMEELRKEARVQKK